jgi:hypothetical protein
MISITLTLSEDEFKSLKKAIDNEAGNTWPARRDIDPHYKNLINIDKSIDIGYEEYRIQKNELSHD